MHVTWRCTHAGQHRGETIDGMDVVKASRNSSGKWDLYVVREDGKLIPYAGRWIGTFRTLELAKSAVVQR